MSEYSKTALSWGGLKDALLYFSYVIALFEYVHVLAKTPSEIGLLRPWERDFLPPDFPEAAIKDLESFRASLWTLALHVAQKMMDSGELVESTENGAAFGAAFNAACQGEPGTAATGALISLYVHYKSCPSLPLICSGASTETTKTSSDDVAVTVSSLKLIDTRSATLEQLLEIRQDAETMEKLRRFRLFAYQNYQGKSKDYIEDDIQTRIADYERAAKKWGFTTASGAITTLLNSSLIAGGVAGSFLTAYCNAPLPAIASAMTATGLAIANMAVSFGQQRFAQKELLANNPVSYIAFAKGKLEGE
jgi:hypothetical protein